MSPHTPHIVSSTVVTEGRFLAYKHLQYADCNGKTRSWEAVDRRCTDPRTHGSNAALIVAKIVPDDEIVLIRQFRPPAGKLMVEFPAGLIDPGEEPGAAALRELAEETGFTGKLLKVLPPSLSTAGMSGESVYMAFVEIDGTLYPPERQLQTDFDESENIVTYRVKRSELNKFLLDAVSRGDAVDSKLLLYSEIYNNMN